MAKYSARVIAGELMKENTQFNAYYQLGQFYLNTYNPTQYRGNKFDPERWREYIRKVELITEERLHSMKSLAGRTLVGNAILGTPGAIIGAVSASDKKKVKMRVLITYMDGKRDLIECTEHIYNLLKEEEIKNSFEEIKEPISSDVPPPRNNTRINTLKYKQQPMQKSFNPRLSNEELEYKTNISVHEDNTWETILISIILIIFFVLAFYGAFKLLSFLNNL
ncbi:hypothetical protein [Bacillus sp. AFS019443]|uniref:hypothetical protein n=1 Tax=Bacillus sp. AFS019443 TaxID=2034279 RepID=UPI000BF80808|nr:hypothetical protein [Bacillus sp. AFS019443]PEU05835.1 hypothetical protein CN524_24750 [Bacillus sp. AFS019443]